ncbi:hypothetical protein OP10G_2427 [Fimbriimonas ginsengisoli Gsoil 348]|uniref:Uncharacterized protein n=1 Tax=Fimbriimonas ginsengisoli Gsoil 348 TaxID=661478 RepID=A0A068NSP1_FIMGI|nr:hypothetical protein OP10G_2427 [Fimbriimonas ginsengisoli Gsoil 348]
MVWHRLRPSTVLPRERVFRREALWECAKPFALFTGEAQKA